MKKYIIILCAILMLILTGCSDDSITGKPTDVRDDTTGKWKKATTSKTDDILDYALDYSDEYMVDRDTHFIINFTLDTTSVLNKMGNLLYVDVHERVKKEEHNANTIGSGMLLKSYTINSDGEITETE